jgi:Protein of unknown function (DUF3592)
MHTQRRPLAAHAKLPVMKPSSWLERFIWLGWWAGISAAAVFLVLAIAFGMHSAYFLHQSVSATGTITKIIESQSDDGSALVYYRPEFSYVDAGGTPYVVDSNVGSKPSRFTVDQQVPIRYEISNPSGAKIDTFGEMWGASLGFGLAAVVLVLLAYWCRFRARQRGIVLNDLPF